MINQVLQTFLYLLTSGDQSRHQNKWRICQKRMQSYRTTPYNVCIRMYVSVHNYVHNSIRTPKCKSCTQCSNVFAVVWVCFVIRVVCCNTV